VLAGRSEESLRELAEPLGLEWRVADALRQNSVFALLEPGDVLVSTVGPFVKWGEPAVRAAIAAKSVYLDSTGEPPFIRRVFEEFGPPAERAGAALLPAMGYDYVPGALAGGLALEEAGERAVRVDVGYYAFGAGISGGTRRSAAGILFDDGYAFRDGSLRSARIAERVRAFHVRGKDRDAISVGGSEHYTLPPIASRLREVNVYIGWFPALAKPLQAGSLAGSVALRVPGVRGVMKAAVDQLAGLAGTAVEEPGAGNSWIAAEAFDAAGERLAEVHLSGVEPYALTAGTLAWAARRAAAGGVDGAGALGPLGAFGLSELEAGCREAGLERVIVAS
jgi:short subunit dehydrogenase-like uncharacterized protein